LSHGVGIGEDAFALGGGFLEAHPGEDFQAVAEQAGLGL
jgi:hypothetical protein